MVKEHNYLLSEGIKGVDCLFLKPRHPSFPYTTYSWRILDEDPNKNWIIESHTGVMDNHKAIISTENETESYFRAYEHAVNRLKNEGEDCFKFFKEGLKEGQLVEIAKAFDFLHDLYPQMSAYVGCGQLTHPI
jgi:hypothetical protein